METDFFESLGLTNIESRIYLHLLKVAKASISSIAESTGIYRPTIYSNIPKLIQKALISKVKIGKRIYYIAENPEKLRNLVENLNKNLEQSLPDISKLYLSNQNRPSISWYEGKKAISDIYESIITTSKKGDCIYRYESPREAGVVSKYYPKLYFEQNKNTGNELEKYVITNEETAKRRNPRLWRHTKYIPESFDTFDQNISQLIFKDMVVFIDYDTETASVIKNQRFADFQLKIFKMFFNNLKDRGN